MTADATIAEILRGNRRAAARAITALENDAASAPALRMRLIDHVGKAHVIGVTGPPGAGKSTLVSALIRGLRALDERVAVVAIDPSSPLTGGAVLGDRIRMGEHQADPGVFIRSLASRGDQGGLAKAAVDVIDVLDAAGFGTIIVETVGAGQSEVEVTRVADSRLVVCPPGLGDDVQAIKAGILEIADAFVVAKADLPDATRTQGELTAMLGLRRDQRVVPPVFKTSATTGEGLPPLVEWLTARTARGTRHRPGGAQSTRKRLGELIAADRYAQHLGLELIGAAAGTATVRMRVAAHHINFNGRCHGGAIFSLGDTALGLACNSHGAMATLVDGQLGISAPVEEGDWLIAHATELSRSRKIGSYRVDIRRARDNAFVATLHGTVYVLDLPAGSVSS